MMHDAIIVVLATKGWCHRRQVWARCIMLSRSHLTWDTPGTRLRWGRLGDISGDSRGRYYPTTLSVLWLMKLIYEAVHRRSEYFCTANQGLESQKISYCILWLLARACYSDAAAAAAAALADCGLMSRVRRV